MKPLFSPEAVFDDLDRVAEILTDSVPDAGPIAPLRFLGSGFFSLAVETESGVVFRLALTAEVTHRYEKEMRLLPWLADRLPIAIPRPSWLVPPSESLPYGAIGYPKLPGQQMTEDATAGEPNSDLVDQLANFLTSLHSTPRHLALEKSGTQLVNAIDGVSQTRDKALLILKDKLTPAEYATLDRWWDALLAEITTWNFDPVLIQSDINPKNLLVDDTGLIVGVLDWEHAAVADPAFDFRNLGQPDSAFRKAVVERYQGAGRNIGGDYHHRLHRYWQLNSFYGVELAVRRGDEPLLLKNIERLRQKGVI